AFHGRDYHGTVSPSSRPEPHPRALRYPTMRMKLLAVPLCVVVILPPATAAPQTVERAAAAEHATTVGVVSGRVVDAGSGAPLDLAVVTIAPIDGGILSAPGGRHGSFLADALVTTTGPMGEYRVEGLAP